MLYFSGFGYHLRVDNILDFPTNFPVHDPAPDTGLAGVTRPTVQEHAPAREIARRLYLKARAASNTVSVTGVGTGPSTVGPMDDASAVQAALRQCVLALTVNRHLFPPTAPPASFDLLLGWCRDGGWEQEYRRQQTQSALQADPLSRLKQLRLSLQDAQDVATQTRQACVTTPSNPNPVTETQIRKYQMAWKVYQSIAGELRDEEEKLQRTQLDKPLSAPNSPNPATDIYDELLQQYGDLGTHYRILCQTLAQNQAKLQQLNLSERDVPVDEYIKLSDLNTKLIAQLQKYTEATRSQTVSQDLQTLAEELMHVVERCIGPTQPKLFADIVRAVRSHTALTTSREQPKQKTAG